MRSPRRWFLVVAALGWASGPPPACLGSGLYTVTDLKGRSSVTAGTQGFTLDSNIRLNNQGQLAGEMTSYSLVDRFNGRAPDVVPHTNAYLYDSRTGAVALIGASAPASPYPGAFVAGTHVNALNDSGQLLIYDDHSNKSLYQNGQMTRLTDQEFGRTLNNTGQMLTSVQSQRFPFADAQEARVIDHGVVTNPGLPPGADDARPVAINDAGQFAVNTSKVDSQNWSSQSHAFLHDGQTWTDLGTLGGLASRAASLNQRGDVAGWSALGLEGPFDSHAMLVRHGEAMLDLGTLPGDRWSRAESINDHGDVVGLSSPDGASSSYRGFLYHDGVMTDLTDLLPPGSGLTVRWGFAINDRGQIVALADDGDSTRMILMSPEGVAVVAPDYPVLPITTPEPSTWLGFAAIGLGLVRRWRRTGPR